MIDAAATRPWRVGGVSRCRTVTYATTVHATPTPAASSPTQTSATLVPIVVAMPTPIRARPMATVTRSPSRATSVAAAQAARDRTDALHAGQDPQQFRTGVEAALDGGEVRGVGDAGGADRQGQGDREAVQRRGAAQVPESRGRLPPETLRRSAGVGGVSVSRTATMPAAASANSAAVSAIDGVHAGEHVDAGADQRCDQPQALVERGEQAVRRRQVLVGQQVAEQAGLRGGDDVPDRRVDDRHQVDQPQVTGAARRRAAPARPSPRPARPRSRAGAGTPGRRGHR